MFDCADVGVAIEETLRDPRVTARYVECVAAEPGLGTVLLVGVVHDHPASTERVRRLLETVDPDVLALELPDLAVPLFRQYGRGGSTPPRLGGEMSAALQAAGDGVPAVGLDAPSWPYLRLLVRVLRDEDLEWSVMRAVARDLVGMVGHALACRFGALVPLRLRLYSPIAYDCSLRDPPSVQAHHETRHLTQQQTFLRAIVTPAATGLIDRVRDESMAGRLHSLRSSGDVVAVVGMEHLETLAIRLRELAEGTREG